MERKALLKSFLKSLQQIYNYVWLFLEIHMQKIIFISLMLLCIKDVRLLILLLLLFSMGIMILNLDFQVCAINFFFVVAVVISINFQRSFQILAIHVMTVAVAVLMVIKMLYQIKYIDHKNWDVNCTVSTRKSSTNL